MNNDTEAGGIGEDYRGATNCPNCSEEIVEKLSVGFFQVFKNPDACTVAVISAWMSKNTE